MVPIRDTYDRRDWRSQTACPEQRLGAEPRLVTIRNTSDVPVHVNEWYFDGWHGQTTLAPKETKTLPAWQTAHLRAGASWPGAGGPGTSTSGPAGRSARLEE